jgi:hypothetical protein
VRLRFPASLLGLLLAATSLQSVPAAGCGWLVFKPPNPDANFSLLGGVTAIAANDVWAFGWSGATPRLQLQHFNGLTWSLVPAPALPTSTLLYSIRAVSSSDVWAVGLQSGSKGDLPLIVHWDGAGWSVVPNPAGNTNGDLFDVVSIGSTYVWAAGFINAPPQIQPLIEHFNGHQWVMDRAYVPPRRAILEAIAGTSLDNIWAGGYGGGGSGALIERWNRATWNWSQSPMSIGNEIISMSARSSNDVWAVGPSGPGQGPTFAERWNGSSWNSVLYPRSGNSYIFQVDATASTGYTWFAGDSYGGSVITAFVDRYRGQWRDMKVLQIGRYETNLGHIAPVPHTADVWVTGDYADTPGTSHNLAERWTCATGSTGRSAD